MDQLLNRIKNDYLLILLPLFLLFLSLKIVYYYEAFFVVLKLALFLWVIFFIPGYFISLLISNEMNVIERLTIGIVICIALTGIISYILGFLYVNIKYHSFIIFILICGFSIFLKDREKEIE